MDRSEYEIQHFGFTAAQIALERNHMIRVMLSKSLESMLEKLTISSETARLLSQQKDRMIQSCLQAFEPQLQAMAALDTECFTIPQHVLLAGDFEHTKGFTEQDEQRLDDELAALKQLFLENSVMIASLNLENSQYDSIATALSDELKVHAQIKETAADLLKLSMLVDNTKEFTKKSIADFNK